MSKRLRNKASNKMPNLEKQEQGITAYRICEILAVNENQLILNIARKFPDEFIKAAKLAGVKVISWQGMIEWIENGWHSGLFTDYPVPTSLRPSKVNYIKICRQISSMSLRDAKEAVEAYIEENNFTAHIEVSERTDNPFFGEGW